ncbi:MAG: beta-propeller domain-containing protein [Clostridia bacterium]|nr:beta-propeller domain-containing protein [Clostridia bacterium]
MKKHDWYQALSLADDKYVEEAHPENSVKPKGIKIFISLAAACVCFAMIFFNLWLFVPFSTTPPDVSKHSDSEYYGLIQSLNLLTYEAPQYKNNAEKLWADVKRFGFFGYKDVMMEDGTNIRPGGSALEEETLGYNEITDNQVEGITEADRIKRSDKYIYYLDNEVLRIYSIEKESSKEVGSYTLYNENENYATGQWEFYLSEDCSTVTVITENYDEKTERRVKVISLDVSTPSNIVKKEEFSVTGMYMSSRNTDGNILLMTSFYIDRSDLDFDNEATFLPQIDEGEGYCSIPAGSIVSPDNLNNTRYTVVMKLCEDTLELRGTAAYLSYSEDVYVSEDHVFLTCVFVDKKENKDGTVTRNSMTEISCLSYGGDNFETEGSITVEGYLKDQWSMDEYEGVLRVFTTTNTTTVREQYYEGGMVSADMIVPARGGTNASLYCIDLSTFEVIASVIDFAPPGEEIRSVRFDGEAAYVCTSIELSDPVFFFDLSDLDNISYKDTGTIDGFSTSLINIGNGFLLGIGRGDGWATLKVEVYEETADTVRSVSSYENTEAICSEEYKSYYVDRKNQLFGFGVVDYDHNMYTTYRYILLRFDGYELVELVNVPLKGDPANMRGVYIDGYMYIFGENDFKVEKVFG